jgi:hypothetical protein
MFEEWLGVADAARSLYLDFGIVILQLGFFILPIVFVYYASMLGDMTYMRARCQYRPDKCNCLNESDSLRQLPTALIIISYIYFFVCVLEMVLYFLCIPYNIIRRLLRHAFYLLFSLVWFLALFFLLMVTLFIFIGVLVRPVWLGPYSIAIVGTLTCMAAVYSAQVKLRTRVYKAVQKKLKNDE